MSSEARLARLGLLHLEDKPEELQAALQKLCDKAEEENRIAREETRPRYGDPVVVLAGDSIFDNARYVPDGSPVIEHLKARLLDLKLDPVLLAVDGSVALDVPPQLAKMKWPQGFLIISCGGNDALAAADVLAAEVTSVYGAMTKLAQMRERFRQDYRMVLEQAKLCCQNVAVCTVYDSVPGYAIEMMTALALFNDVIIYEAGRAGIPVIDLRLICDQPEDYSAVSPIEPSEKGGKKIAEAIGGWVKLALGTLL